jgi:hypothetical protein
VADSFSREDGKGFALDADVRIIGFFANAVLYGLIGYGIGKLMYGNEVAKQQPTERR